MTAKKDEFKSLGELATKMGDMMEQMLNRSFVTFRGSGEWAPQTNVYENADSYQICMELAGMREQDFEVRCLDELRVVVSGRRGLPRLKTTDRQCCIHVIEIDDGHFRREIDLPTPIEVDRVSAAYDAGFLWITLPKKG